jgi:hypothetical protein
MTEPATPSLPPAALAPVPNAILRNLRRLHVWVGASTVAAFLVTGVAMLLMFPGAWQSNPAIRYLYRANHVYILFAGLLNLALGAYVSPGSGPGRRVLQLCGSVLLLSAPVLLLWAFVAEPWHANPSRPITLAGVAACLLAVAMHLFSRPFGGSRDAA